MCYGHTALGVGDRCEPRLGTLWEQYPLQIDNRLTVGVGDHMGVDVERGRYGRMAQLLLDDLGRDA